MLTIVRIADSTHGRRGARRRQPSGVSHRDVLRSAVRVDDRVPINETVVQGLIQRIEHEIRPHHRVRAPPDDVTREYIDDKRDVDDTVPRSLFTAMRRATVQRAPYCPSRNNCGHTVRTPYTPRWRSHTRWTCSRSTSSRRARTGRRVGSTCRARYL